MTITEAVIIRTDCLLKEHKMTKKELAEKSRLSVGTIASIYKKLAKSVNLSTVFALARAFGLSVNEFLNDEIFDDVNIDL